MLGFFSLFLLNRKVQDTVLVACHRTRGCRNNWPLALKPVMVWFAVCETIVILESFFKQLGVDPLGCILLRLVALLLLRTSSLVAPIPFVTLFSRLFVDPVRRVVVLHFFGPRGFLRVFWLWRFPMRTIFLLNLILQIFPHFPKHLYELDIIFWKPSHIGKLLLHGSCEPSLQLFPLDNTRESCTDIHNFHFIDVKLDIAIVDYTVDFVQSVMLLESTGESRLDRRCK